MEQECASFGLLGVGVVAAICGRHGFPVPSDWRRSRRGAGHCSEPDARAAFGAAAVRAELRRIGEHRSLLWLALWAGFKTSAIHVFSGYS